MTESPSESICPRDHAESRVRTLPSGKRVCIACRRLREKRKRERRDRSWPFIELLPVDVGFNLGHHRTTVDAEHTTGEDCHCMPDHIPHEGRVS